MYWSFNIFRGYIYEGTSDLNPFYIGESLHVDKELQLFLERR